MSVWVSHSSIIEKNRSVLATCNWNLDCFKPPCNKILSKSLALFSFFISLVAIQVAVLTSSYILRIYKWHEHVNSKFIKGIGGMCTSHEFVSFCEVDWFYLLNYSMGSMLYKNTIQIVQKGLCTKGFRPSSFVLLLSKYNQHPKSGQKVILNKWPQLDLDLILNFILCRQVATDILSAHICQFRFVPLFYWNLGINHQVTQVPRKWAKYDSK